MPNRLAKESSPYLLQHAGNPVDWWAWGPEAIAEARRRDVPIFLSIGYSTCYWCHVMERESFENPGIAQGLNAGFVCVKVDREERPDVDDIYMAATLLMNGHGGWPMTVFLEPGELRPFYAGTYFPPETRGQMPGLPQVASEMGKAWKSRRADVIEQAAMLAEAVREQLAAKRAPVGIGAEQVSQAVQVLLATFDRVEGGFGRAPKFPQPCNLEFLLEVRERADQGTRDAIDACVRLTLDKMMCGGIHDQVGGGFHRYSVDGHWIVPHFEKMLYDNAMLLGVYARAARVYGDGEYARVARTTAAYLMREMTVEGGAFATAQDAEVDHREGLNYVWTPEQVREVLQGEDAEFAVDLYGLKASANFRDPHHPQEPAVHVLRLDARLDVLAAKSGMAVEAMHERVSRVNAAMYDARQRRKQPLRDDKVLASWNGLAIAALADAGASLGDPALLDAARRAAEWVMREMIDDRGALLRAKRGSVGRTPGFLEDCAAMAHGLLRLHAADAGLTVGGEAAVELAEELVEEAVERFGEEGNGFFDTREAQADLFVRTRSTHDGAMPSGVSIMANVLVDLREATGESGYGKLAAETIGAVSAAIAESPVSTINSTRALFRALTTIPGAAETLAAGTPAAKEDEFQPIEIYADTDRIEVGDDVPGEVNLVVRIAPGYHLYAANPGAGAKDFVATRVSVINGTGIAAYADYPEGTALAGDDSVRVYEGEIEIRVAVEKTGEIKGRPLVALHYQACNATECLKPATLELDVAIDVV